MKASEFLALRVGTVEGWRYRHLVRDLGELRVDSGRLEASDPYVNLGDGLTFRVEPGVYPVRVTLADVSEAQDGSHLRETYLSVLLADGEVARVETLVPEGAEPPQDADEYYGVAVDAGTVGFADATAIARCMPPGDWYNQVFDTGRDDSWFALMDSADHYDAGAANIVMPLATAGENVVLCHSGWGDGFYPVLGSFDAAGRMLGVHIDLQLDAPDRPDDEGGPTAEPKVPSASRPKTSFWRRLRRGARR